MYIIITIFILICAQVRANDVNICLDWATQSLSSLEACNYDPSEHCFTDFIDIVITYDDKCSEFFDIPFIDRWNKNNEMTFSSNSIHQQLYDDIDYLKKLIDG